MIAHIAAILSTPLPQLLAMPWDELLDWWSEAEAIHRGTRHPER